MPITESQFLHQRDPNLHKSAEVTAVVGYLRQSGEQIPNQPDAKLAAHLGFLAHNQLANDGILTGDKSSIERQIDAHVIKPEDVPEAYFELQRRIAREQGHGDIAITKETREQLVEAVRADQRASLSNWVEYLGAEAYPDWFKQYTYDSIVKMGLYDKEKGEFGKRSDGTTAPYPELNREALAYVFDKLNKHHIQGKPQKTDTEQLKKLLKGANFSKLYVHALKEVSPPPEHLKQDIRGTWTKFDQTTDPRRARLLSKSLQGHGTGWCTAGESTAETHLAGGDFYVYYTRDEEGKETIPRIAIRMEDYKVAEVRGINLHQELEPELADITSEQLADLPGGEEYIRKAEDMKRLTAIEKKTLADVDAELTGDELRFLYELDHEIKGFGYKEDPRVQEIRTMRGDKDKPELARILPEAIREQLMSAYTAYVTVTEQLGHEPQALQELEQLLAAKDKEWQRSCVYDYLVEKLITDGARFNLVATPNVEASEAQVVALAEAFGKGQPYETYAYDNLYRKGHYTGQEWSGNNGAAPVRLSLIPTRFDGEMGTGTVDTQAEQLRERQANQPELDVRVPSVLEAVTYWYSLRAQGDKLDDNSAYNKTYIRHFDLESKTVDGWSYVPGSCVYRGGRPCLGSSDAGRGGDVRLAVG